MQALNLHVKHKIGTQPDALARLDKRTELLLLLTLDAQKSVERSGIAGIRRELFERVQIGYPAATDTLCNQRRQLRIAKRQPTARCDAVRLIIEAVGIKREPFRQRRVFKNLRVYFRYAVDRMRGKNRHVRHVDHLAVDDAVPAASRAGDAARLERAAKRVVKHDDIRIHLRDDGAEQADIPFFKRLGHNGVVCVGERALHNRERLVKRKQIIAHQDAQQLRNRYDGMRIVELDGIFIGKM